MKLKYVRPTRVVCECGRQTGQHKEAGISICDRCFYLDGQFRKNTNLRFNKKPTN